MQMMLLALKSSIASGFARDIWPSSSKRTEDSCNPRSQVSLSFPSHLQKREAQQENRRVVIHPEVEPATQTLLISMNGQRDGGGEPNLVVMMNGGGLFPRLLMQMPTVTWLSVEFSLNTLSLGLTITFEDSSISTMTSSKLKKRDGWMFEMISPNWLNHLVIVPMVP